MTPMEPYEEPTVVTKTNKNSLITTDNVNFTNVNDILVPRGYLQTSGEIAANAILWTLTTNKSNIQQNLMVTNGTVTRVLYYNYSSGNITASVSMAAGTWVIR